ncbi:hypothetical protein E4U40_002152 [Claviceps sp. LM458 group G5]|nr:hypothetical protein E4U40_002152 [Claviceps sp. LM458 group G5]
MMQRGESQSAADMHESRKAIKILVYREAYSLFVAGGVWCLAVPDYIAAAHKFVADATDQEASATTVSLAAADCSVAPRRFVVPAMAQVLFAAMVSLAVPDSAAAPRRYVVVRVEPETHGIRRELDGIGGMFVSVD